MITGVRYRKCSSGRCVLQVRFVEGVVSSWLDVRDAVTRGVLPMACSRFAKQHSQPEAKIARVGLMELIGLDVPDGVLLAFANGKQELEERRCEKAAAAQRKDDRLAARQELAGLEKALAELWESHDGDLRGDEQAAAIKDDLEKKIAQLKLRLGILRPRRQRRGKAKKISDDELRYYKPGIFGVFKPTPVNNQARKAVQPQKGL